jgi:tetraacyldisaccharide 4'-kinase
MGLNLLGTLYGAATATRNRLYDRGWLNARRLEKPVISVGNLSLGGSGKTPFVILLVELLRERGLSCAVLSRGYGRKRPGVRVVEPHGSSEDFGDEPLEISRRLGCPVVVGESRYQAGRVAEKEFACDLHIVDDGFQHRSLARDFDLVLLAREDLSDTLLPAGRLREPLRSLARADSIVTSFDPDGGLLSSGKFLWRIERGISLPEPPARAVAFCGIARPKRFLEELEALGIELLARRFYRDHHRYSPDDIDELLRLGERTRAEGFITTEKDSINMGAQIENLGRVSVARVRMALLRPPDALDTMLARIRERRADAVRKSRVTFI